MDQVKQFILVYGYVTDQGTKELYSSLYTPPHNGAYILSPNPSTLYENFTSAMVDISPSVYWFIIIDPSGSKLSICIDSCYSSEKKPRLGWFPLGDNHSSKYWSIFPWYYNLLSIGFVSFNYLIIGSFQHGSVKIPSQKKILINNNNYSLSFIYQLSHLEWTG